MAIIENLGLILIAVVVVAIIILILLIFVEKRLFKKVLRISFTKNEIYIEKISKLDPSNPKTTLLRLNKIAKTFFNEAFKTKTSIEYAELANLFKKRNNKMGAEFSTKMDSLLYSGKNPTREENKEVTELLAEIIASNKILSKQEKTKLDKKSLEKDKTENKGRRLKKPLSQKIKNIFKRNKNKNSKK